MGSGPGIHYEACPVCRGLKEKNAEFRQEAVGHKPACWLAIILEGDKS